MFLLALYRLLKKSVPLKLYCFSYHSFKIICLCMASTDVIVNISKTLIELGELNESVFIIITNIISINLGMIVLH